MTSLKQIEANRRNAENSTGPRSEAGKQRSSRNAVRHGLTAETVIEPLEDAEDYAAFEEAIAASFDPETAVERELILRLASLLWRLRRATSIETALFQVKIEHDSGPQPVVPLASIPPGRHYVAPANIRGRDNVGVVPTIDTGMQEIDRIIAAGVRFGCVLADAGYGLSAPFRQGLTARKLAWAVGIPRHLKVYPLGVQLIWPIAARGRSRKRHIPDILSMAAEDMLANTKTQES